MRTQYHNELDQRSESGMLHQPARRGLRAGPGVLMSHSRVTASVEVNETSQEHVAAAFQGLLDNLAIEEIAIYDSEISCISLSEVEGPDPEMREE